MRSPFITPATRSRSGAQRRRRANIQWDARRLHTPAGCRIGTPSRVRHPHRSPSPIAQWPGSLGRASQPGHRLGLAPSGRIRPRRVSRRPPPPALRMLCRSTPPAQYRWAAATEADPRSPERCPQRKLAAGAPNAGQRRRPRVDAAADVFARRRSRIQQAIVGVGKASSGLLQFLAMGSAAITRPARPPPQRPVARSCGAARVAGPMHGRLHLPSARDLLGQHLLTWD